MAIHDEVAVGSLLVLADAGLDQRSIFHRRKRNAIYSRTSFSVAWLTTLSPVVGSKAAPRVSSATLKPRRHCRECRRESFSVIAPHWKIRVGEARVSGGRPEEKNILLGGSDQLAQSFGKHFPQPGTARENIEIGFEPRTIREVRLRTGAVSRPSAETAACR